MKDFVSELGCLGFTARLKRLSDALVHDGRKMYRELGLDIEPNWYIIFRLLKRRGPLSVTEIANKILLAHPSVIAITNKMIKAGYLASEKPEGDSRKRILSLTEKSDKILPVLETVWEAGEQGVIKALEGTDAMHIIGELEARFFEKGFKDRTMEELNSKTSTDPSHGAGVSVEICRYEDRWAKDFARLNYEWVIRYFTVEAHDREMLDDPFNYIIKPGGQILFAKVGEEIVGTVALIVEQEDTFEVAKMGVTDKFKGIKIGKKLLSEAIDYARKAGKKRLVLESNTKLTAAINLYINSGFKVAPLNAGSPYSRCNIRMALELD